MNRRALLATIGAAGVAGVAGCQSSVSDAGETCSTPTTDDVASLLPGSGDDFTEQTGDPPRAENAQQSAGGMYRDNVGNTYGFIAAKYGSESAAKDDTGNLFSGRTSVGTVGYVVLGAYVFAVNAWPGGGDKSKVKTLLAKSSALNTVCVNTQIGYQES